MFHIKVACILDDFSFNCFKYECDLFPLSYSSCLDEIKAFNPQMLLVESAWMGYKNSWQNKFALQTNDGSTMIEKLITLCNEMNIPTVFWNKEDPIHFDHFLKTAGLFDFIFSTSLEKTREYPSHLGYDNSSLLPFGVQPKLHNPIGIKENKEENFIFAGTWYSFKYPRRKNALKLLLTLAKPHGLHIYDRTYYLKKNIKLRFFTFPYVFRENIRPSLNYEKICEVYKKYNLGINVNTVENSDSMFSRRALELLSCGVPVVSNPSSCLKREFGEIISFVESKDDFNNKVIPLLDSEKSRSKISLLGQRAVFSAATYEQRFFEILNRVFPGKYRIPSKEVLVVSNPKSIEEGKKVLHNFISQNYRKKKLFILLEKSLYKNFLNVISDFSPPQDIHLFSLDSPPTFENVFKILGELSHSDFLSFFDPNSLYCDNFLCDLVNTFKYSTSSISGKSIYYSIEDKVMETNHLEKEYSYVSNILPESCVFKTSFLEEHLKRMPLDVLLSPFTTKKLYKSIYPYSFYSSDRFNFLYSSEPVDFKSYSSYIAEITI